MYTNSNQYGTDVFAQARSRVTAREAALRYGLALDRSGRALCPFHPDRHPSMSFRDGRFRCWACNASGTSIDLTAQLFGLSPLEAVRRLDQDFGLGLPLDRPASPQEQEAARKRREQAAAHARFEQWRQQTLRDLNACLRRAHRLDPKDWQSMSDADVLALGWKEGLAGWADALGSDDGKQQLAVFQEKGVIEPLLQQILQPAPKK